MIQLKRIVALSLLPLVTDRHFFPHQILAPCIPARIRPWQLYGKQNSGYRSSSEIYKSKALSSSAITRTGMAAAAREINVHFHTQMRRLARKECSQSVGVASAAAAADL